MMPSKRSYAPRDFHAIVADVSSYGKFVPWCTESRVLSTTVISPSKTILRAELAVGFLSLCERYTSEVTIEEFKHTQSVMVRIVPLVILVILFDFICTQSLSLCL